MRYRYIIGYFLLFLLLSVPSFAGHDDDLGVRFRDAVDVPSCKSAFFEILSAFDREKSDNRYKFESTSSVSFPTFITGKSPGPFGGTVRNLRRERGKNWGSLYEDSPNAPQGDPRFLISVIGENAAELFGYKVLSDYKMSVPDADALNATILELNNTLLKQSKDPIAAGFYEQERGTMRDYLVNYIEGRLPIFSGLSTHRVHDLSLHIASIFLPSKTLQQSRRITKRYMEMVEAMMNEYKQLIEDHPKYKSLSHDEIDDLSLFEKQLLFPAVTNIDVGTGALALDLSYAVDHPNYMDYRFKSQILRLHFGALDDGSNADISRFEEGSVARGLTSTFLSSGREFSSESPIRAKKLHDALRKLDYQFADQIKLRLIKFLNTGFLMPEDLSPPELPLHQSCASTMQKMKMIKETGNSISQNRLRKG